jgi:Beta-propeller repeat
VSTRSLSLFFPFVFVALLVTTPSKRPAESAHQRNPTTRNMKVQTLLANYAHLPLSFEPNLGQSNPRVKFLSHGAGYELFLADDEVALALNESVPQRSEQQGANNPPRPGTEDGHTGIIRIKLVGANTTATVQGTDELSSKSNYFIGNDMGKWRTNVPNYARVRYDHVYPGVDLVFYGNQRCLEHDFIVAPGFDPRKIALRFEGARKISMDSEGALVLSTAAGEVRLEKPLAYQQSAGQLRTIAAGYALVAKDEVQFALGAYDKMTPLVIDPVLVYSTYLGGSGDDVGRGVVVDEAGNVYVAGSTTSADFPITKRAFQKILTVGTNAFVAKIDSSGSSLIYSTFLGGTSGLDSGGAIALDGAGNVYLAGDAGAGFPVTPGAFQTTFGGGNIDVFVAKLNRTGSELIYSTYLGGSSADSATGIALDSHENAYVTGGTGADFPTTPGAFQTAYGGDPQNGLDLNAFVSKINGDGSKLIYSTYLGRTGLNSGIGIAVDREDRACIAGFTEGDFPTTPGASQTIFGGANDAFVAKLASDGASLVFSTFLGGSQDERAMAMALDKHENIYVTGFTFGDFPTTPGAFQTVFGGNATFLFADAFLTKLSADGGSRIYSTYLGGNGDDRGFGIAVTETGDAIVTGQAGGNFPITPKAPQTTFGGGASDAFVSKLNRTGSTLLFSSYLGGSGEDTAVGVTVGREGDIFITGATNGGFPTTPGALQTTFGGQGGFIGDAFVAKFGRTREDRIEDLENEVTGLVAQRVLKPVTGDFLLIRLGIALERLNSGRLEAAEDPIRTFIGEVDSLRKNGILTASQTDELIDRAETIVNKL